MIGIKSSGSTKKTEAFIDRVLSGRIYQNLDRYGQRGVDALSNATPRESGETADSWSYRIIKARRGIFGIAWYNSHEVDGVNIAILIQYGHGTGTGGYVQGRDYINPAIRPVFDQIIDDIWKEVKAS